MNLPHQVWSQDGHLIREIPATKSNPVLQQLWRFEYDPDYCTDIPAPTEWRDVPTEAEETK